MLENSTNSMGIPPIEPRVLRYFHELVGSVLSGKQLCGHGVWRRQFGYRQGNSERRARYIPPCSIPFAPNQTAGLVCELDEPVSGSCQTGGKLSSHLANSLKTWVIEAKERSNDLPRQQKFGRKFIGFSLRL